MNKLFKQLNTRVESIAGHSANQEAENSQAPTRTHGGRMNGNGGFQHANSTNSYTPKTVKLDFPRFNGGEDPTSWLCRAEQFFQIHETPVADQVSLASFHLEGDAQLWYQLLKQEMETISWEEFKEGLHSRYGPNQFLDFFGELTKLQQTGSVQDYQSRFEKLLVKDGPLPQARQVSCFISGLRDSIRTDVQANRPTTLTSTIALARLYEARDLSHRKSNPIASKSSSQSHNATTTGSQTVPMKRMTTEELNERRRKRLCLRCNEKFGPGHRCKKLFLIQACLEDSDEDVEMEEDSSTEEQLEETPGISLHAIAGTRTPETMRVNGSLGRVAVTVLVDSGSTHNFVSEKLAKRVGLQPILGAQFEVMVASGEKLASSGKCTHVQLNLQGVPLYVDFYLLPLEGYDVVLGTQWLSTLGSIVWNFAKLQMKFTADGREVMLQGVSAPEN